MRCLILDYKRFYLGSMHGGLVTIHRCTSSSHRYGRCDHITHLLTHSYLLILILTHTHSLLLAYSLTYSYSLTHTHYYLLTHTYLLTHSYSLLLTHSCSLILTLKQPIMKYFVAACDFAM